MLPYILVFSFVIILSSIRENTIFYRLIALGVLVLFIGFRNNVGTDYEQYQFIFNRTNYYTFKELFIEPGFYYINRFFKLTFDNFYLVTLLQAFVVIALLYSVISKYEYYTFSLFLFLMSVDCGYTMVVNIMRQAIAVALFFYSSKYIIRGTFLKFALFLLLGALFHYSVLFLLPVYFLLRIKLNYKIVTLIFLIVFILSEFGFWRNLLLSFLSYTSYGGYLTSVYSEEAALNSGMGKLMWRCITFVILLNYDKMLRRRPDLMVYLNMYFLFALCRDVFSSIDILYRMRCYLQWSEFIVVPLFCNVFLGKRYRFLIMILFSLLYIALFCRWVLTEEGANLIYKL